ncbi:MAG: response regulator, partial [Chryseolinea sp.]
MKEIAVAIYEDNLKLREVLNLLFSSVPEIKIVGTYSNCNNVRAEILLNKPDVVVMDIDMPGYSGIDGVRIIKEIDASVLHRLEWKMDCR